MSNIIQETRDIMLKALEKYKKDKSSCKEFYPYTKELSSWLEKKEN